MLSGFVGSAEMAAGSHVDVVADVAVVSGAFGAGPFWGGFCSSRSAQDSWGELLQNEEIL